jgi:hypothetical protein
MACNRPIVSVPVGDVPERIKQSEGCYLSAPQPYGIIPKSSEGLENLAESRARETIRSVSAELCAGLVPNSTSACWRRECELSCFSYHCTRKFFGAKTVVPVPVPYS